MAIRLSVVMMISIINQFRYIEEKMLFINSRKKMSEEVEWCKIMKCKHFSKDMILTKDDERNFKSPDKCYICNEKYSAKDVCVRDYCHKTEKCRGSAHQDYDINYKLTEKIPVIFHNLKGYI